MCGHFTVLVWKGVKELGCGCIKATDNSFMYICRYKSGDTVGNDTPNMNMPDNYPSHVLPLKGAGGGTAAKKSANGDAGAAAAEDPVATSSSVALSMTQNKNVKANVNITFDYIKSSLK